MVVWLSRSICWLAVMALMSLGATPPALAARPPAQVELVSDFEIDRRSEITCQLAVPTAISGTITLTIDFVAGTAGGWIEGTGKGDQDIPPSCSGRDGTDVFRAATTFSGPISRDADDVLSGTNLIGRVDGNTGEFLVHAILAIEGWGYHGIPGKTYSCAGSSGLQSECPIGEIVTPQPAFITGRIVTGQAPELHVEWYTNFCAQVTPSGITYGRTGCPTGSRATPQVASFAPATNEPPIIEALRVNPLNPFVDEAVSLTVEATDPDGDPLTYTWAVEGLTDADGVQVTWQPSAAVDYTVTIRVEDDMGGVDEESTKVSVLAMPPVTTADTGQGTPPPANIDPDNPEDRSGDLPDDEELLNQSAPALSPSGDGGGLLGDIPLWVVVLVALAGGMLALSLLLGSWGAAEKVTGVLEAPGPRPRKTPPAPVLGNGGSGCVTPTSAEVQLLDSDGRTIGTLYAGQSYQTAGMVTSYGKAWVAVSLPDGPSGWVDAQLVKDEQDPLILFPPGLEPGLRYQTIQFSEAYDFPGRGTRMEAGKSYLAVADKDGATWIHDNTGEVLGPIHNASNPNLEHATFTDGPLIETLNPKSTGQWITTKAKPGEYLLGQPDEMGRRRIYDAGSGKELGQHYPR